MIYRRNLQPCSIINNNHVIFRWLKSQRRKNYTSMGKACFLSVACLAQLPGRRDQQWLSRLTINFNINYTLFYTQCLQLVITSNNGCEKGAYTIQPHPSERHGWGCTKIPALALPYCHRHYSLPLKLSWHL